MADPSAPDAGAQLEVLPAQPQAESPAGAPAEQREAVLEVLGAEASSPPQGAPAEQAPARKKVGADWRKHRGPAGVDEALTGRVLAGLQSGSPLVAALWPELGPAELLGTQRPTPELFARRWSDALSWLDTAARRDHETRARVEVAQLALQKHRKRLAEKVRREDAPLEQLCPLAFDEFEAVQVAELEHLLGMLAGEGKQLFASDLLRLQTEASRRGLDPARVRELCAKLQLTAHDAEARPWQPLASLPDAPATLDALSVVLLRYPAQAYAALRSGEVERWLRANGAPQELVESAKSAVDLAAQGASETLVVHTQAWRLGRRELVLRGLWLRSPQDLLTGLTGGHLSNSDLQGAARDGVLSAWLTQQGWGSAAAAAQLAARGEPLGLQRLLWSLGEPFALGALTFRDVGALGRAAMHDRALVPPLVDAFRSGELLAWLESLPPAQRDAAWLDRLRGARSHPRGDTLALWAGLYAQTRARVLEFTLRSGETVTLHGANQLSNTLELSRWWDALKERYRSGELLAWLSVAENNSAVLDGERPLLDDDGELNELLWELGHTGLVLEWGQPDLPVTSLADLVRAYRTSWRQLESQLSRGYVLDWLERFHSAHKAAGTPLGEILPRLRAETGRLPAGYLSLKLALLCGLTYLPLDPCDPGDAASFRGYGSFRPEQPGAASSWEPLREHFVHGTAHLWITQNPAFAGDGPRLLRDAFRAPNKPAREVTAGLLAKVAAGLGTPVPSPMLAAELGRYTAPPPRAPAPPPAPPKAPAPTPAPTPPTPQHSTGSAVATVLSVAFLVVLVGTVAGLAFSDRFRSALLSQRGGPTPRGPQGGEPTHGTPGNACSLSPPRVLPAQVLAERGLTLQRHSDEQLTLGWVVPGATPTTRDEAMVLELDAHGSWRSALALGTAAAPAGRLRSPRTVLRAWAQRDAVGTLHGAVDELTSDARGEESLHCGDVWWPQFLSNDAASPRQPDARAVHHCRSVLESENGPFVLGFQAIAAPAPRARRGARPSFNASELLVLLGGPGGHDTPLEGWRLRLAPRWQNAEDPAEALRRAMPESVEATSVPAGVLVVLSHGNALGLSVVDPAHRRARPLTLTLSQGGSPGPARVAFNGREALVVYSDVATQGASNRALFALRVRPDGSVLAHRQLVPPPDARTSLFAPSVTALPSGEWLVAWTQGATSDSVEVRLRRYSAELQERDHSALTLANFRGPRLVTVGDHAVLAAVFQGDTSGQHVSQVASFEVTCPRAP